jgi:hypothetical protein
MTEVNELLAITVHYLREVGLPAKISGSQILISLVNRRLSIMEVCNLVGEEIPLEHIRRTSDGVIIDLTSWVAD